MAEIKAPRPGTLAALVLGCTCPVLDNEPGELFGGLIYNMDCPIHSPFPPPTKPVGRS